MLRICESYHLPFTRIDRTRPLVTIGAEKAAQEERLSSSVCMCDVSADDGYICGVIFKAGIGH